MKGLLVRMRGLVLCAAALVFALAEGNAAFAQQTSPPPQAANAPIVSHPTSSGISRPLWDIPQAPASAPPQGPINVPLHPLPQHQTAPGGQHANDRALQTKAGARLKVDQNPTFGGIVQDGYIPPDPNIAVGPNNIVEVVNSEIAVFTKGGLMETGYPKKLGGLWNGMGGSCATNNAGDPIVQYDRLADRWLITQLGSVSSPYSECFAVSQTGDPTGAYNLYAYSFGTDLNDYPKFGVWPTANNSAYLATYNLFSHGQRFAGAELCAYDRQAMLSGASSPASICYTVSDGGYLPSDLDGATAPSDGEPGYFLNFNTLSSLGLYKLTPNFANPNRSTFVGPTNLAVDAFQEACGGTTCIPQPSTNEQLDSLGDRLMYRLAFRKFSDHEAMVVNHSVTAGSSVGVRWYELDATTPGAFTVAQQGTFAPDSSYRWMGSIAMDQAGDTALGYSRSSSSVYPGIYLTGRMAGDPPNTMESETVLKAGGGSQTGYTRWGDYTSMRIDPSDDCTFWYADEYYPTSASYNWYTFIGSFKFSGCGSTSSADFSLAETPSPLTVSAGSSATGTVTVTSLGGFSGDVALSSTCSLPLTCSFYPNPVAASSNATVNTILTVSVTAGTSAGNYVNTITGTSGGLTHSTTFTVSVPAASAPAFTISAASPTLTIQRGSQGSDTITLSSSGASMVNLSVSGLPSQTSASFSSNPASSNSSSTLTIIANPHGPRGTYALTVTGNNGAYSESTPISLTIQ